MRLISSSFANSSCILARLGRLGLPRNFSSNAGTLPGVSSGAELSLLALSGPIILGAGSMIFEQVPAIDTNDHKRIALQVRVLAIRFR